MADDLMEIRMMTLKPLLVPVVTAFLLMGCANDPNSKEKFGTLIGAAGGGLLGAQFGSGSGKMAAVALGTLGGAFVGSQVGQSMDQVDRLKHQQAMDQAATAPVGETITWSNPNTGNSGTVTPTRDGQSSTGAYCREFQQTVIIGGKEEQAYGVACRQPDGAWEIKS